MKKTLLIGAALLAGSLAFTVDASAHGGTYRGPGDTVPPGGGGGTGGGPATPGPGGPGTPGPSGPSTPGPSTPGAPGGTPAPGGTTQGPMTGGGEVGPDLTTWDFWWGFNKDQYLNLKQAIQTSGVITGDGDWLLGKGTEAQGKNTLKPTEEQIRGQVVPALKKVLEKERGNDIITGAMIALAKIGDSKEESGTSEFEQIIKQFLKDSNQEISETAAVALGILANPASVDILTQLLTDSEDARRLLGKTEVPWRTRAFAAYGLGLIGNRCGDPNVSKQIAATLVEVLNSPSFATRDIKVAAMTAYGLTPLESLTAEAPEGADLNALAAQTRQGQIAWLMDYLDEAKERANSRTRHYMVRAHVPTAMARLLADGNGEFEKERDAVLTMLVDVVDEHSKYNVSIQQSAILAMGQVADARKSSNKKSPHALAQAALERLTKDGDQQGRRYALIAMAQAAARTAPEKDAQGKDIEDPAGARDDMRKAIVSRMAKAKGEQRAWAGLALGVHGRALADASQGVLDSAALAALKTECEDCKTPSEAGAYMLGLGLLKDTSSADLILKKLDFFGGSDETRGHAAVALGLMGYTQAKQRIQEILEGSAFRPELLKQAAVALGLLGDKSTVPNLLKMLGEAKSLSSQAAIASALGTIGDKDSVDKLLEMLADSSKTQTARGFAAVALGIVCDKELFPWNSKISININYRANTVTLTGEEGTGILDLL